ncbi:hypothetical protein H5410_015628, partial [Solanum commersonii]
VEMAPKDKNVAGSKRNRKGKTFGSSSARESIQKFGKKVVQRYGWEWFACQQKVKYMGDEFVNEITETKYKILPVRGKNVKFSARILNELLGTPNSDPDEFNSLKDKPPYGDIRHTLCGVDLTIRVWLKIVCSVLLPTKHLTEVTRDRVVLVYMPMTGMPINVGAILRQNMMKFRNNLRWRFYYGGLITYFLRAEGIEEETVDMTISYHRDLTGKLVDVTRTKALYTSNGLILFAQERQARDDIVIARMFGKAELQLRIGGCLVTDEEIETLADRYLLIESATFLCKSGPAFMEPLDDDEATADDAINDEEDNAEDEEANALM